MSREAVKALAYRRYRLLGPDGHHQTLQRPEREELNSPGKEDTTSTAGSLPLLIMVRTSSTMPYSLASSAVNQRSRSASRSICSMGCPVWNAVRSTSVRLMYSICSAWILI